LGAAISAIVLSLAMVPGGEVRHEILTLSSGKGSVLGGSMRDAEICSYSGD
jgi:hypothetical protein